ncbi:hypothetical protein ACLKA7_014149 [Drosophila subpalustris]
MVLFLILMGGISNKVFLYGKQLEGVFQIAIILDGMFQISELEGMFHIWKNWDYDCLLVIVMSGISNKVFLYGKQLEGVFQIGIILDGMFQIGELEGMFHIRKNWDYDCLLVIVMGGISNEVFVYGKLLECIFQIEIILEGRRVK